MSQTYKIGKNGETAIIASKPALQAACDVLNRNKHRGQENWELHPSDEDRKDYYGVIARVGKQSAYQIDSLEALLVAKYYRTAFV